MLEILVLGKWLDYYPRSLVSITNYALQHFQTQLACESYLLNPWDQCGTNSVTHIFQSMLLINLLQKISNRAKMVQIIVYEKELVKFQISSKILLI